MNKVLTLALILLCPFILISQTQISNIEYFEKTVEQRKKGFISIGDQEYFIEQGPTKTTISLVKENQLELIHEITDRPPGVNFSSNQGQYYTDSNSGLLYDGEILYEIYPSHVYAINILTGQVDHIIDLSSLNVLIYYNFTISADHYYFSGLQNNAWVFFEYDRQTEILSPVGVTETNYHSVLGLQLYLYGQDLSQVVAYDLKTQALDTILTAASGKFLINEFTSNGERQLLLTESDSSSLYLIDDQHNLSELTCLENVKPEEIYLMSDVILYTKANNDSVYVINRNNCALITSYLLPTKLSFRDSRELYDEYVLLSNTSDWSGLATFFIYDVREKTFTELGIRADFPLTDRAIRYDNKLYLIVWDDIHYIGILPHIVAVDLNTKLVSNIDDYDREEIYDVVIGEHQNNETFHIYYDSKEESTLQRYQHNEQELNLVHKFDYLKNVGIRYGIYENTWHNDHLFFYCRDGVYVLKNNQVSKLIEVSFDFDSFGPVFSTSGFVKKGGHLHVLLPQDSAIYKVTMNLDNFSYQQQVIPDMHDLGYRRPVTENAIINIPNGYHPDNTGYYDLEDEQFKSFQLNGVDIRTSKFDLSGNNLLLKTTISNNQWILFDMETESAMATNIPDSKYSEAYPDGEGGFYLTPHRFNSVPDLLYLNADGNLSTIASDFSYTPFYNGERLDGTVKSVAFDGDGEMIILSAKGGDYRLKMIPDDDLLYYQTDGYFWKETDKLSVLEVPNGSNYDTYIFSFFINPIKITPNGRTERLVEAWVEDEKVVLLYVDRPAETLFFIDYEFATGETTIRQSLKISRTMILNKSYFSQHIRYEDNRYLITLDDTMHGLEPWTYDSNTGDLSLLKDMRDGFASSNPTQYLMSPDSAEVYFIASTASEGRQLFKLDQTVSTQPVAIGSTALIISPSPTTGTIRLNQDLKNLQVYNLNGQLLYSAQYYSKNEQLNLSPLVDGLYYIVATTEEGVFCREKFVVSR